MWEWEREASAGVRVCLVGALDFMPEKKWCLGRQCLINSYRFVTSMTGGPRAQDSSSTSRSAALAHARARELRRPPFFITACGFAAAQLLRSLCHSMSRPYLPAPTLLCPYNIVKLRLC